MSHHSSLARAGEHVTSACSTLWLYWLVFSITASGTGTPGKRTFLLCHWIWSDRKFGLELQQLNCCHSEEACRKPGQLRGWRTQRGTRFWWHYLAFTTPWLTPHHPLGIARFSFPGQYGSCHQEQSSTCCNWLFPYMQVWDCPEERRVPAGLGLRPLTCGSWLGGILSGVSCLYTL